MGFWDVVKGGLGGFLTGGPAGAVIGGGAALLGGDGKPQQTNTNVDPKTQAYLDQMRNLGLGAQGLVNAPSAYSAEAINSAMNPYINDVVKGVQGQYDYARQGASNATKQQATLQGAFGGSRAAVTEGARLGALDRAQAGDVANVLNAGYGQAVNLAGMRGQEPLDRYGKAMNIMNLGLGQPGQTTTVPTQTNPFSTGAGAGLLYDQWKNRIPERPSPIGAPPNISIPGSDFYDTNFSPISIGNGIFGR